MRIPRSSLALLTSLCLVGAFALAGPVEDARKASKSQTVLPGRSAAPVGVTAQPREAVSKSKATNSRELEREVGGSKDFADEQAELERLRTELEGLLGRAPERPGSPDTRWAPLVRKLTNDARARQKEFDKEQLKLRRSLPGLPSAQREDAREALEAAQRARREMEQTLASADRALANAGGTSAAVQEKETRPTLTKRGVKPGVEKTRVLSPRTAARPTPALPSARRRVDLPGVAGKKAVPAPASALPSRQTLPSRQRQASPLGSSSTPSASTHPPSGSSAASGGSGGFSLSGLPTSTQGLANAGTVQESPGKSLALGADCDSNSDCLSSRCDFASPSVGQTCIPNDGMGKAGDYCTHRHHCGGERVCAGEGMGHPIFEGRAGTCMEPYLELGDRCGGVLGDIFGGSHDYMRTACKSGRCDVHSHSCIPADGTGAVGGYCTHDNHCIDKICNNSECRQPESLALGERCSGYNELCSSGICDAAGGPQKCIPQDGYGQAGDYCSHPNHCASRDCANNLCEGVGDTALGQSCLNDTQCVSGRCDGFRCIPNDGTGIVGDYCSHDNHCIDRICADDACREPSSVALGERCHGYNTVCASGRCDAAFPNAERCIPNDGTGSLGSYCTHHNQCRDQICRDQQCMQSDSVALGQTCHGINQLCQSGRCDMANPSAQNCIPNDGHGTSGDYCTHPNHCVSGSCINSQCLGGDTALGGQCSNDTVCSSQRCDTTTSPRRCIPNDGDGRRGEYCTHNNHCRPGDQCAGRECRRT